MMDREEARKKFIQNIILDKAMEAIGQFIGANVKASMSIRSVARFEDHHAKMKYNGRSGIITFMLAQNEFKFITNSRKARSGKKEIKWAIPSFEDPKFDPQKIINTILSIIKRIRKIDIKYQILDYDYDKTLRDAKSEFESLEKWEEQDESV